MDIRSHARQSVDDWPIEILEDNSFHRLATVATGLMQWTFVATLARAWMIGPSEILEYESFHRLATVATGLMQWTIRSHARQSVDDETIRDS